MLTSTPTSTFDSTKRSLSDLLTEIVSGKIQLPDFQRGWVWDDEHVRSLLVSVARSFPVGAIMLLEAGGEVKFQVRPVENVRFTGAIPEASLLILDGQQRLTTLTQVLALAGAVKTFDEKKKEIERHYYLHIPTALEGPERLEDALIALEPDRKQKTNFGRDVTLDLSTPELEYAQMYFPCGRILNWPEWLQGLNQHNPTQLPTFLEFQAKVLSAFAGYQIPIIELKKETSKEAVCLVFEKVNTGGVSLSVFELMTASYAADGYNLRDDWYGSDIRNVASRRRRLAKESVLEDLQTTDFLQAITMLHTLERRRQDQAAGKTGKAVTPVSAKRASILSLPLSAYEKWADRAEAGFLLAAKFLRAESLVNGRDLPYRTQLAPLAAVLAHLKERYLEPRIYEKLARWYWCGVLGELYGGAVETRIANDMEELLLWIDGEPEPPRTVTDASFQSERLDRLSSRLSAAYKGINVLVLREGARDFFWKSTIRGLDAEEINVDIHHIFPQDWCEKKGIPRRVYNSIVNKTPISYKANRMIGGFAPSVYLSKLQNHAQVKIDDAQMDVILSTHRIDPKRLRADDYDAFYEARRAALMTIIGQAMGLEIKASV